MTPGRPVKVLLGKSDSSRHRVNALKYRIVRLQSYLLPACKAGHGISVVRTHDKAHFCKNRILVLAVKERICARESVLDIPSTSQTGHLQCRCAICDYIYRLPGIHELEHNWIKIPAALCMTWRVYLSITLTLVYQIREICSGIKLSKNLKHGH